MKTGARIRSHILTTESDNKMIIIRLIVGLVFISEGIQKYLFLEVLGPDYFKELGFIHAYFWAYFTGACEIFCGILILFGLMTRLASLPFLIIMIIAFITTKLPLLSTKGIWTFFHEYKSDFCLTMLVILLIIYGGGRWSVDSKIFRSRNPYLFVAK